ncbi:fimbrial protein [Yersinia massiliensis]|uniref:fimbrial protein n=1 Tax=Yersinia massiliensis TaxID=419257 RepID=UPI0003118083|nr:fimbrial protein [Yersinia massiliensis]
MKKKLIVTSLLAATVFASAANAATINITGSIAAAPCIIDVASSTSNVTMPAIFEADLASLTSGGVIDKSSTPIEINLSTCPALASNAVVTFTGAGAGDAFSLGNAVKGVALKIYDSSDNEITAVNGTAVARTNALGVQANQKLEYKLKYVKTAEPFTEGAVSAAVDFDVTYN